MEDQIPRDIMDDRLQRLQARINEHQLAFNRSKVGVNTQVLIERKGRHAGQMIGRSPWLQSVHVETNASRRHRRRDARRCRSQQHDRRRAPEGRRLMARRDLAAVPDRARLELEFEQPYLLGPLFGDYDRHLITIENRLGVHIAARGNRVQIEGEPDAAARARDVLIGLYNRLDQGHDVDAEAVEAVLGMAAQPNLDGIIQEEVTSAPRVMIRTRKKTIVPRSAVQTAYMEALARDEMIFALGPAGTGKTYLAVAQAVSQLISGKRRPADPVAPGGRGGRAPRLSSRRHEGEGRSLSPPALRRALRHAPDRAGRAPHRFGRDRDRSARLHARPHPQRRLHHPRRGAEHHSAADEDVPHPVRHAKPDGDLRRSRIRSIFPIPASPALPTRSAGSNG